MAENKTLLISFSKGLQRRTDSDNPFFFSGYWIKAGTCILLLQMKNMEEH